VNRLTRRSAALLAVAVTCALPVGGAQAGTPPDNAATAIVQQDDGRVFDLAWDIDRRRGDDPVTNHNSATARARCLRCRATAIAFQIVLVTGSPTQVGPINSAEAVNVECTECQAVAEARQWVRVMPGRVRFTGEGRVVLADVRDRLRALEAQDLPADQLHLAVEEQEARVDQVLATQVVLHSGAEAEPEAERLLQSADLG
jgi:hypothetical protein